VYKRQLQAREAAPLISALLRQAERTRDHEVEQALSHLPAADAGTRQAFRAMADRLTAKLLHAPIEHLRETATPTLDGAVLKDAFDLTDSE